MNTSPISHITAGNISSRHGSAPQTAKLKQAASEFEAFLLGEMLRSSHQAGSEEDASASSLMESAEEQFAQALSRSGGLGIAKMVVQGLAPHADR